MPKRSRSLKGGMWPFDIFSNPKDPNAPQSAGWFRNPFKKTTQPAEATQVPAPAPAPEPAPAPVAVTQQDTPVSGGKRRTQRKSRSNKKKSKSRKRH